ncbi:uncharacterized protein YkwD [Rhizobium petrolearium]|uniref:CAP domain-containing protein n=1 Tax=Neorhizobium petrolearium TaxID=515361 RepID=UPI001AEA1BE0|nr:CAP domain-containing protein [Neorhizobium petrolearium]MBP1842047.1 uncharacterized protein YkwD [Neorhizobium petrolearium]
MTTFQTSSRRGFLVLSGMGLMLAGCSTTSILTPTAGAEDETEAALPMVNTLRQGRGLSTLALNSPARKAAVQQAVRMAKANEMKHLIGFGDDFGARMKKNDVALPAAENIASGQNTVEAAVRAWIDSPKHLENILGSYRGLGVAMARTSTGAPPYWAMVLSG